ncbi:MAG: class IV adenylate cyclase [Candidatus Hydrogenedentota bacterium]|nr:MAG: class IV adenylate cyclase [Candidatus Hydrogenedentota bacterium]
MPMEIELKIRLEDLGGLRASLRPAGAIFEGRILERNWLYDHPERRLAHADKLLRLREDRQVHLTFKGPRQQSTYKEREELELEFPDTSSARSLLEAVGFVKWFYYEKIRETWRLGSCEVVLDELPELGLFVEIEAPTREEIEKVIKQLRVSRDHIASTYVEMLYEFSRQVDKPMQEFKFSPQHKSVLATDENESM